MSFLKECIFKMKGGFLTINPLLLEKWDALEPNRQHEILCAILMRVTDTPHFFDQDSLNAFIQKTKSQFDFFTEVVGYLRESNYAAACDQYVRVSKNFQAAHVLIADLILHKKNQSTEQLFLSLGKQPIVSANPLDYVIQLCRVAAWDGCPIATLALVRLVLQERTRLTSLDDRPLILNDSEGQNEKLKMLLERLIAQGIVSAHTQLGILLQQLGDIQGALQHWCSAAKAGCEMAVMQLANFFSDRKNDHITLESVHFSCVGLKPLSSLKKNIHPGSEMKEKYIASLHKIAASAGSTDPMIQCMIAIAKRYQQYENESLLFDGSYLNPQRLQQLVRHIKNFIPLLLRCKKVDIPNDLFDFLLQHKAVLVQHVIENSDKFKADRQHLVSSDTAFGCLICTHRGWPFGKTRSQKKIEAVFWPQPVTATPQSFFSRFKKNLQQELPIELQPLRRSDFNT